MSSRSDRRAVRGRARADGGRTSPIGTAVLSTLMVLIGVALVVRTVAAGGGALATGVLLGLLFMAAGAGRLWAERRR